MKSDSLVVLPLRPAVPTARKLVCTSVICSVDVVVMTEDGGGSTRCSVLLRHNGDFQHTWLYDSQNDMDVSESFCYVNLSEIKE